MNFRSTKYTVQGGDTLTSLAKQFELPSWKTIASYSENANLLKKRGDAENIQPGDVLFIPPNPIKILEYKIVNLKKLKGEFMKDCEKMQHHFEREYQGIQKYAKTIDFVSTMLTSLVSIGAQGAKAMGKIGAELTKANAKFGAAVLKNSYDNIKGAWDLTGEVSTVVEKEEVEPLKEIEEFWSKVKSPSFWAKWATGTDPDLIYHQQLKDLQTQRVKTISNLNRKIIRTNEQILRLKNP